MKKVILAVMVAFAMVATSCKGEKKSDASSEKKVEKKAEEKKEETKNETSSADVPNFSDQGVQDYVNAYEEYMKELKKVVESKDMDGYSKLSAKGAELGQKATEALGKVSGADAEKLTKYMEAKSKEMTELTNKLMAQ